METNLRYVRIQIGTKRANEGFAMGILPRTPRGCIAYPDPKHSQEQSVQKRSKCFGVVTDDLLWQSPISKSTEQNQGSIASAFGQTYFIRQENPRHPINDEQAIHLLSIWQRPQVHVVYEPDLMVMREMIEGLRWQSGGLSGFHKNEPDDGVTELLPHIQDQGKTPTPKT